ncbi:hypothetical protein AAFF_G00129750 [Aldrovandia affinis]|uniref:Uncharacterized protein n=1 Tax=Aldrovandia affinis TaxID=143900 RepID=A0AAD7RR10_9TELE|nr:hypothetical protein AAFF_G00129750 [Aldrovandia affinis]
MATPLLAEMHSTRALFSILNKPSPVEETREHSSVVCSDLRHHQSTDLCHASLAPATAFGSYTFSYESPRKPSSITTVV